MKKIMFVFGILLLTSFIFANTFDDFFNPNLFSNLTMEVSQVNSNLYDIPDTNDEYTIWLYIDFNEFLDDNNLTLIKNKTKIKDDIIVKIKQTYANSNEKFKLKSKDANVMFMTMKGKDINKMINKISGEKIKSKETRDKDFTSITQVHLDPVMIIDAEKGDNKKEVKGDKGNAEQLNNFTNITGYGYSVTVIDTGINYTAADFGGVWGGKVIAGYDYCAQTGAPCVGTDSNPMDFNSHGSHVAGILAAQEFGIAPNVSIVAIKSCNAAGQCSGAALMAGIDWSVYYKNTYNITAILMSVSDGGNYNSSNCPNWFNTAIQSAVNVNLPIISSTGNNGYSSGISYPACDPRVYAVGATDYNSTNISSFSNGKDDVNNLFNILYAPGNEVKSVCLGSYCVKSGTSMAAPHVAAVFVLVQQLRDLDANHDDDNDGYDDYDYDKNGNVTLDDIFAVMQLTGRQVGNSSHKKLDVWAVLQYFQNQPSIREDEDRTFNANGQIQFPIGTLSSGNISQEVVDICVVMRNNLISVDSNNPICYPLINLATEVTITKLINLTAAIPTVLKNGQICSLFSQCKNISYNDSTDTINFKALGFSNYTTTSFNFSFHGSAGKNKEEVKVDKVHTKQESGENLTGYGYSTCIIDSGVNYNHTQFDNYLGGYDYCANNDCIGEDNDPLDLYGHGTAVSGIIFSKDYGVAPDAGIVSVKVADANGDISVNAILGAIDWCINHSGQYNISAIVISIGDNGNYNSSNCPDYFQGSIVSADSQGILVVSSVGNGGNTESISYPSCEPVVVSVGATVEGSSNISNFSNNGQNVKERNIFAPGDNITTTNLTAGMSVFQGTSLSAPHVAAAKVLIDQFLDLSNHTASYYDIDGDTDWDNDDVYALLNMTGYRVGNGKNVKLDIWAAINYLRGRDTGEPAIRPEEDRLFNSEGEIQYSGILTANASLVNAIESCVIIKNNLISVNDGLPICSGLLGVSAELTMSNLPNYSITPYVLRNGEICSMFFCPNQEYNLLENAMSFGVTSFSNYTTQGGQNYSIDEINVCQNLTIPNTYYNLSQSISSTGTCININASNVILDCQGYTIEYATTGTTSRYGIDMRNVVNVTVQNCIIKKPSALGTNGYGIYALQTNNSLFENNTIMTNGTTTNTGLYLDTGGRNNTIRNNTIITRGSSSGNYGININTAGTLQSSATIIDNNLISVNVNNASASDGTYGIHVNEDYTIIKNNILNIMGAVGSTGNRGINLPATSIYTNINNNTINLYFGGLTTAGIYLSTSGHNITNNTIISHNAPATIGIIISGTTNIYLSGNQLNVSGGGIYIASNTITEFTGTTILSNNLVYGKPVMYYGGADGSPACPNNTVLDNPNYGAVSFIKCSNITLKNYNPDKTADPLLMVSTTDINISNATIYKKHLGVRYPTAGNNRNVLENSNITTYGYSDSYGINLYGSNGTINNNIITTEGIADSQHGIFATTTDNTNITNNRITTGGTSTAKGMYFAINPDHMNIINNTIIMTGTSSMYALYIDDADDNNFINNTINITGTSDCQGISLGTGATRNYFYNNIFNVRGSTADSNWGLYALSAYNNTVNNNSFSTFGTSLNYGIYLWRSANNTISNNNILTNGSTAGLLNHAFYLRGISKGNYIVNNTVISRKGDGIRLNQETVGLLPSGDIFENNNLNFLSGTNDLYIEQSDINNTILINQYISRFNITGNGSTISFIAKNSSGNITRIDFINRINGSGNNLSNEIQTRFNYAYVNLSYLGFNVSANITFYNIPNQNINKILRDGVECNPTTSPSCYNFTALYGTVIFNVSSWSNYTIFQDNSYPNITYQSPGNNTLTGNQTINFTGTFTDNLNLSNAILNIYNTTGLYNQTTITLSGIEQTIGIVISLIQGVYTWFWNVFDTAGNNYIGENYTLTAYPGSNVTNSTIINSTITTSNINNSLINNSIIVRCNLNYINYQRVDCYDSNDTSSRQLGYLFTDPSDLLNNTYIGIVNITDSIVHNSIIQDSNISLNSLVNNSIINQTIIINSIVNNSNYNNATIINATINNNTCYSGTLIINGIPILCGATSLLINFTNPTTYAQYSNQNYITINTTQNGTDLVNVTFNLYNNLGILNRTITFNLSITTFPFVTEYPLPYYNAQGQSVLDDDLHPMNLSVLWSSSAGGLGVGKTAVVKNDRVYVGSSTDMYCFNATNGTQIWTTNVGAENGYFGVVATNDRVYTYVYPTGRLYALNSTNGSILWYVQDGATGDPAFINYYEDRILIGGNDAIARVINATNGSIIWSQSMGGTDALSLPVVYNNIVYFQKYDGLLNAYYLNNGSLIWSLDSGASIIGPMSIFNNILFPAYGGPSARLRGYNLTNGTIIIDISVSNNQFTSPMLYNNMLIYTNGNNNIYAINYSNPAQLLWNYNNVCSPGYPLFTNVYGGHIYAGCGGDNLFIFNASNGTLMRNITSNINYATVTTANGILYVANTNDNKLYAYKATDFVSILPTSFYNFTNLTEGTWYYNATVTNLLNQMNYTETREITLDLTSPNITSQIPDNNTITGNISINFTVVATDNYNLSNATLNIYNQSGLYNQQTITSNSIIQSIGLIVNLIQGIYTWFYQITDFVNNQYTGQNYTLTVYPYSNVTNSTINITNSIIYNSVIANSFVTNSTVNSSYVNYSVINNSFYNNSFALRCNLINVNYTSLICYDSNDSYSKQINGNGYIDPSNLYNNTYIGIINITDSTVHNSIIQDSNITISLVNNSVINQSRIINSTINLSDITNAIVTNAKIENDICIYGNWTVNGIDYCEIGINITFITPPTEIDNVNRSQNNIFIKVNVTSLFNITNITYRISGYINTTNLTEHNFTELTDGTYYYNVTACNNQNCNSTSTRRIVLDTRNPNITLILPLNNTLTNNQTINFTFNLSDSILTNQSSSENTGIINITSYANEYNVSILLNISYQTGMQLDFSDIRFYNDSNKTQRLGHWFYNNTVNNGVSANVYVYLNHSYNRTIYMSWGNLSAAGGSNITEAFMFADDFNSPIDWTNKWQANNQNLYAVHNGFLIINGTGPNKPIASKGRFYNIISEGRMYNDYNTSGYANYFLLDIGAYADFTSPLAFYAQNYDYKVSGYAGAGIVTDGKATPNVSVIFRFEYVTGNQNSSLWTDGKITNIISTKTTQATSTAVLLELDGGKNSTYVDWVFIRHRSITEPTAIINYSSASVTLQQTNGSGIYNYSLNIYNTGGLVNKTVYIYSTLSNIFQSTVGIIVTLANGVYTWFVEAFDFAGNKQTSENYTLIIGQIDSCADITESGTFSLKNNITSDRNDCIQFKVSNINLDLNGYSINSSNYTQLIQGSFIENVSVYNGTLIDGQISSATKGLININDSNNILIYNLKIDNAPLNQNPLYFNTVNNLTIQNVYVNKSIDSQLTRAVLIKRSSNNINVNNITFVGNNGTVSLQVDTSSNNITITNSLLFNLNTGNSTNILIENNIFEIYSLGSGASDLGLIIIKNNTLSSISSSASIITNNAVIENNIFKKGGFNLYFGNNVTIQNNVFDNFSTSGYIISLSSLNNTRVIYNNFTNIICSSAVLNFQSINTTFAYNNIVNLSGSTATLYDSNIYNNIINNFNFFTLLQNSILNNNEIINGNNPLTFQINNNNIIVNNTFKNITTIFILNFNNTIYNNIFNVSNDVFNITIYNESSYTNFNITKTLGTNIIGRPYLGGNYWTNYNATGYSDTCLDSDGDFICDVPYNLTYFNDYLPLSVYDRVLINFTNPTPLNNSFSNLNYIPINITVEAANENNVTYILFNQSGIVNETVLGAYNYSLNLSVSYNGNYSYYVTVCNINNICNSTEIRDISIKFDKPLIEYIFPTLENNTYINTNSFIVNVSANITEEKNITFYIHSNKIIFSIISNITKDNSSWDFTDSNTTEPSGLMIIPNSNIILKNITAAINSTDTTWRVGTTWNGSEMGNGSLINRTSEELNLLLVSGSPYYITTYKAGLNRGVKIDSTLISLPINYTYLSVIAGVFNGIEYNNTWLAIESFFIETNISTSSYNITYNYSIREHNWTNLSNNSTYNFYVGICDNYNNCNSTLLRTIYTDFVNPNINLITPLNNTNISSTDVTFTYNLTDTISGIKNATLNVYNVSGLVNQTFTNYSIGTMQALVSTTVTLINGFYNWFVETFDFAGNKQISQNYTFNLSILNTSQISPPNGTVSFIPFQNFTFNITSIVKVNYAELYLYNKTFGDLVFFTNKTISYSGSSYLLSFFVNNLTNKQGYYEWYLRLKDNNNYTFNTQNLTLNISAALYNQTYFNGSTTPLYNGTINGSNVSGLTLHRVDYSRIKWLNPVNIYSADFDSYVQLDRNYLYINESLFRSNPTLNSSAILTFFNTTAGAPSVYKNGVKCYSPECIFVNFSNREYSTQVSSFSNYTVVFDYNESSINNNTEVYAGDYVSFQLMLNFSRLMTTPVTAVFYYNNQLIGNSSIVQYPTYTIISSIYQIPADNGIRNYSWIFNIGGDVYNSSNYQVNVTGDFILTNCENQTRVLTFITKDVYTDQRINSTLRAVMWYGTTDKNRNITLVYNSPIQSSFDICFSNTTLINYIADIQVDFESNGYYRNFDYLNEYPFPYARTNYTLNLLPVSTNYTVSSTTYIVQDISTRGIANIVMSVFIKDINNQSVYKRISGGKTDFNGHEVFALRWYDTYYTYNLETDNGTQIMTTDDSKISATPVTFRVTSNENFTYDKLDFIDVDFQYLNASEQFRLQFTKPVNSFQQVCLVVDKKGAYETENVCNICSSNLVDTLYCPETLPLSSFGNGTYSGYYHLVGGSQWQSGSILIEYGKQFSAKVYEKLGYKEASLYAFLIGGLCFAMMLISPILAIAGVLVGILLASILGFTALPWGIFIGTTIAGGVLWLIIKR